MAKNSLPRRNCDGNNAKQPHNNCIVAQRDKGFVCWSVRYSVLLRLQPIQLLEHVLLAGRYNIFPLYFVSLMSFSLLCLDAGRLFFVAVITNYSLASTYNRIPVWNVMLSLGRIVIILMDYGMLNRADLYSHTFNTEVIFQVSNKLHLPHPHKKWNRTSSLKSIIESNQQ